MSSSPWYPHYVGDWVAATQDFSPEEYTAYHRMLNWQWVNGALPMDDARRLCQITGLFPEELERALASRVRKHFPEGLNPRLEREREFREKQRQNGSKGGRPKTQTKPKQNPNPNPNPNPNETQTKPKPKASQSQSQSHIKSSSSAGGEEAMIDGYPNLATAIAMGQRSGGTEEMAAKWWRTRQAEGWEMRNGNPLPRSAVEANLKAFIENWRANELRHKNHNGTNGSRSGVNRRSRNIGTAAEFADPNDYS